MSAPINSIPHQTARPVAAGIFNIVIGAFCVIGALVIALAALLFIPAGGNMIGNMPVYAGFGILLLVILIISLGALSIVSGIFSLQRRMWGWVLVGSIAAAFISTVFGIASSY